MRALRLGTVTVMAVAAILVIVARARVPERIRLTVRNVGIAPLDSVVALTTGKSYLLGTLPGGGTQSVLVGARGESHVELEHGSNPRERLIVDAYFETGYRGTIDVDVTSASIVNVRSNVRY